MQLIAEQESSDKRMSHTDSVGVMDTLDSIRNTLGLKYDNDIETL